MTERFLLYSSLKPSEKKPETDVSNATECSPIKRATKHSSKRVLDDSDDEDRSSNVTHVSGDKKAAGNTEKDHNGTSDKSHEKAEPEEPNSAVNESSSPSCSTSRDEITPKRKTGTILKIFNQLCKSDF